MANIYLTRSTIKKVAATTCTCAKRFELLTERFASIKEIPFLNGDRFIFDHLEYRDRLTNSDDLNGDRFIFNHLEYRDRLNYRGDLNGDRELFDDLAYRDRLNYRGEYSDRKTELQLLNERI